MTLFDAPPREHTKISKHLTAEHREEEYIPDKGMVVKWVRDRKQNHWLDSTYNSCVAGHLCGARLEEEIVIPTKTKATEPKRPGLLMPDGRAYLATER